MCKNQYEIFFDVGVDYFLQGEVCNASRMLDKVVSSYPAERCSDSDRTYQTKEAADILSIIMYSLGRKDDAERYQRLSSDLNDRLTWKCKDSSCVPSD